MIGTWTCWLTCGSGSSARGRGGSRRPRAAEQTVSDPDSRSGSAHHGKRLQCVEGGERSPLLLVDGEVQVGQGDEGGKRDLGFGAGQGRAKAEVRTSAEGQEGLKAFLEKREPGWRENR